MVSSGSTSSIFYTARRISSSALVHAMISTLGILRCTYRQGLFRVELPWFALQFCLCD
jgi:hypothetical protein